MSAGPIITFCLVVVCVATASVTATHSNVRIKPDIFHAAESLCEKNNGLDYMETDLDGEMIVLCNDTAKFEYNVGLTR